MYVTRTIFLLLFMRRVYGTRRKYFISSTETNRFVFHLKTDNVVVGLVFDFFRKFYTRK